MNKPNHKPTDLLGIRESPLHEKSPEKYTNPPDLLSGSGPVDCKEDARERACAVPAREHVPGLSGGDLTRHRPSVSAGRRQSRSARASGEADRGQGRRRPAPDAGRLLEG